VSLYRRALSSSELLSIVDAGPAGKSAVGPYINSPSHLAFVIIGQAYAQTFTAIRATPPVAFTVSTASELPLGLTLTAAGVLSGVPSVAGGAGFVVRATDAAGLFYEQLCASSSSRRSPPPLA
jgi:Putative Ig domain